MKIIPLETPSLGDRSYVIVDGDAAAVIDPQRDIDRVERLLVQQGARLSHVFETHIHNDYVTGGLELSRRAGATYVLSADEDVAYERTGASDGDEFKVGNLVVRAAHTPGHTPTHLSYILLESGKEVAVFTGGSMLFGTVGRTDLISDEATEELTRAQFHSVRRIGNELPGDAKVLPTHGFGSFCSSASSSGADASTIDGERKGNVAFTTDDEDAFVEQLLSGLTAYPRYYVHMAPINRSGPAPVDLSAPTPVDAVEIRRRIHLGEWVVDLRSRKAFARQHINGTINMEIGQSFSTYLGWIVRWDTPVTLVGDTQEEVAEAQRQMARIGIDRPSGAAAGGIEHWGADGDVRSYRMASFEDLATAIKSETTVVLDVRRDDEWESGAIAGAVHIPLHSLEERISEVPHGEVWVHCASGYRASIAASLLDRDGRTVISINDDWGSARNYPELKVTDVQ